MRSRIMRAIVGGFMTMAFLVTPAVASEGGSTGPRVLPQGTGSIELSHLGGKHFGWTFTGDVATRGVKFIFGYVSPGDQGDAFTFYYRARTQTNAYANNPNDTTDHSGKELVVVVCEYLGDAPFGPVLGVCSHVLVLDPTTFIVTADYPLDEEPTDPIDPEF